MWTGPNRKSPRLKGFDYASNAAFFVTVCTYGREHLFGEIVDGEMVLNEIGDAVWWQWYKSEEHRPGIHLDALVIMPNHIHGIVIIQNPAPRSANPIADPVGTTRASSLHTPQFKPGPPKRSLGAFVGGFKSAASKSIHQRTGNPNQTIWQERYHDRIIRDERELNAIRTYIEHNPANWASDEENL